MNLIYYIPIGTKIIEHSSFRTPMKTKILVIPETITTFTGYTFNMSGSLQEILFVGDTTKFSSTQLFVTQPSKIKVSSKFLIRVIQRLRWKEILMEKVLP